MKLPIKQWENGTGRSLRPMQQPEYSLDELLVTCTKKNTRMDSEDRAWLQNTLVDQEREAIL